MARPLKLDDAATRNKLLKDIEAGYQFNDACARAGIDYSTFRRWLRDGEPPEPGNPDPLQTGVIVTDQGERKLSKNDLRTLKLKRQFYHATQLADGKYLAKFDKNARTLAGKNYRDTMDYARRRWPDRYGTPEPRTQTIEVGTTTNSDGATTTFARIAADALADQTDD